MFQYTVVCNFNKCKFCDIASMFCAQTSEKNANVFRITEQNTESNGT